MEQTLALKIMDPLRLRKNAKRKNDCCAHERAHCGFMLSLTWKLKGPIKKEGKESRGRSWHAAHVGRDFGNTCNELGLNSIEEKML